MLIDILIIIGVLIGAGLWVSLPQRHPPFTALTIGYALVLCAATIVALAASAAPTDWLTPDLAGSDGETYWEQATLLAAQGIADFRALVQSNYLGYQIFLAALFSLFSQSLLVGLVANNVLLLLTLACIYRATLIMTESPRAATYACLAFMLTSAHVFYSLVLLKEPAVGLAFALILLALAKTAIEKRTDPKSILYMLIGLAIILTMRATALLFLLILLGAVASLILKRRAHLLAVFAAVIVVAAPLAQNFTIFELNQEFLVGEIFENQVITSRFEEGDLDLTGIAGRVGSFYVQLPFYGKAVLFPVAVFVQAMLPFDVWSSAFITEHASIFFYRNLNLLWFLFVFPLTLFSVSRFYRIPPGLQRRVLLAGMCYYVFVAIIYGGLIPRYGAHALIYIYPSIGYWLDRSRQDAAVRTGMNDFLQTYYALSAAAAVGYFTLQVLR